LTTARTHRLLSFTGREKVESTRDCSVTMPLWILQCVIVTASICYKIFYKPCLSQMLRKGTTKTRWLSLLLVSPNGSTEGFTMHMLNVASEETQNSNNIKMTKTISSNYHIWGPLSNWAKWIHSLTTWISYCDIRYDTLLVLT